MHAQIEQKKRKQTLNPVNHKAADPSANWILLARHVTNISRYHHGTP